jgi:geranylgeranyl pyrophosphate synthase
VSEFTPPESFLAWSRDRIDRYLDEVLPAANEPPASLHEAMRYAVLSGGKRIRPALAHGAALALGAEPDDALPVAAAVELVHAYSLVHDDLPAMDDDRERRGRPTVHVKFGQATAILTGDALLAEAFRQLAREDAPPQVVAGLAEAASSRGLVGGQADDLAFRPEQAKLEEIVSIHARKTASLFRFSTWGVGRLLSASDAEIDALERFGHSFGMAFQLVDDLLDADVTECTILHVLKTAEVRERTKGWISSAQAALERFGARAHALRGVGESLAGQLT